MSDLPDKLDPRIEALYRQGSTEQPGAGADAAILALARSTAADSVTTSPRSSVRRWGTSLALAATVVLSIGIVTRIGLEEDAASGAASTGAAPASSARPAEKLAASDTAHRTPAPDKTMPATESARRPSAPAGTTTARPWVEKAAPVVAQSAERERVVANAENPVANTSVASARPGDSKVVADAARTAAEVAQARAGDNQELPPAPAQPASRAMAAAPAQGMAMKRADVAVASAERGAAPALLTLAQESSLSVEAWLAYVLDLRRAGRHEAAEASLARFKVRHPQAPLPDAVLGPIGKPSTEPK